MSYAMRLFVLMASVLLACCTQSPPVNDSRDKLWAQFGGKSVDTLLMTIGTPARESKLTDGSRLLTYVYSSVYDYGSPYAHQDGCELTFMAQSPGYKIKDVAMKGNNYECSLLAQGHTGMARYDYIPPPAPMPYITPVYRAPR